MQTQAPPRARAEIRRLSAGLHGIYPDVRVNTRARSLADRGGAASARIRCRRRACRSRSPRGRARVAARASGRGRRNDARPEMMAICEHTEVPGHVKPRRRHEGRCWLGSSRWVRLPSRVERRVECRGEDCAWCDALDLRHARLALRHVCHQQEALPFRGANMNGNGVIVLARALCRVHPGDLVRRVEHGSDGLNRCWVA